MTRTLAQRIGARVLASILQAATFGLLAKDLSASGFAKFSIVMAVGYLASGLLSLGTSARLLNVASDPDASTLVSACIAWRILVAVVVGCACVPVAFVFDVGGAGAFAIALITLDNLADVNQSYLSGSFRQGSAALSVVLQRALPLLGLTIQGFIYQSWLVSTVSCVIAMGLSALNVLEHVRTVSLRHLLRTSGGYALNSIASSVQHIEIPTVSIVSKTEMLGSYAFGSRLMAPMTLVATAIQPVFIPEMSRVRADRLALGALFRRMLAVVVGVALLVFATSVAVAPWLVEYLGPDYVDLQLFIYSTAIAAGVSGVCRCFQAKFIALGAPGMGGGAIMVGFISGLLCGIGVASRWSGALFIVPIFIQGGVLAALMITDYRFARGER